MKTPICGDVLVVWTTIRRKGEHFTDHWEAFRAGDGDALKKARRRYRQILRRRTTYSASVVTVVISTDYEA